METEWLELPRLLGPGTSCYYTGLNVLSDCLRAGVTFIHVIALRKRQGAFRMFYRKEAEASS